MADSEMSKLIRDITEEVAQRVSENDDFSEDALCDVLERRFLPLLQAGQAMAEWEEDYRTVNHLGKIPPQPFRQWDVAYKQAMGG